MSGKTTQVEFAKKHRIRTGPGETTVYPAGFKGEIPAAHAKHAKAQGALVADPAPAAPEEPK